MMEYIYFYEGAVGRYAIRETEGKLTRIWLGDRMPSVPEEIEIRETPLLREAAEQLSAYFDRRLKVFQLPLAPAGTEFQRKVWGLLQEIPYGDTITYGELARRTGDPKACRAVGTANGRNPLPIVIPCHRVIGAGGKLVGYTGGLEVKIRLLQIEGLEFGFLNI